MRCQFFSKKAFHERTNIFGQIYVGFVLHGGTNDQIMPEEESLTNTFPSNLNTINLKVVGYPMLGYSL